MVDLPRSFLTSIRSMLPRSVKRGARQAVSTINMVYARTRSVVGVQPISQRGGADRGTPIHRYYLERFLREFSSDIVGHCLELGGDYYTSRFGGNKVTKLDILDKAESNKKATIVADLTTPNIIPSDCFDCIICIYVLHLIFEVHEAVADLCRILKPGGVLLVAVPHIGRGYYPEWHQFFGFTPEGLHLVLAKAFGAENVTVRAYGNSLTAAGNLRGLAACEFIETELDYHDPDFAVGVFARAQKRS